MPDLSFHEDPGSLPSSQDPRREALRQESAQVPVPTLPEHASQTATLSPHRRLLLSLVQKEEQRYFAESVDPGNAEALSVLARILARERARRKRRAALLSIVATLLGFCGAAFLSTLSDPAPAPVTFGSATALVALGLLAMYNPIGRLERAVCEYLLHLDDRRSIGLLLEQRNVVSVIDRERLDRALMRLLPDVGPEEAAQLTSAQRSQFHRILGCLYSSDLDLRLAIIAALARIGDRRDLGALYSVASAEAATRGEQAVRTAAQKCLYDLQARLDFGKAESIPDCLRRICAPVNAQTTGHHTATYFVDADSLYALISLLPQLTAPNYRQILSQQADRDRLYSLLTPAVIGSYGFDRVRLYREIVRTLERVGDTKAMSALRQVAVMEAPTDSARQLRAAAREALQVLRRQFEKEKIGKTLLRASAAPDTQSEELLRAAAPAESASEPNELLRASAPQQERGPITAAALSKAMDSMRRQSQEDTGPGGFGVY